MLLSTPKPVGISITLPLAFGNVVLDRPALAVVVMGSKGEFTPVDGAIGSVNLDEDFLSTHKVSLSPATRRAYFAHTW